MNSKRNYRYIATLAIVRGYLLGALVISYTHVSDLFGALGLTGWQQDISPLAIDGFAVLGMIARSHTFASSTRKIGMWTQVVAGALSLVANIGAGHNAGERIFGALVVAAYVFSEWFGDRMRPATDDSKAAEQAAAAAIAQAQAAAEQAAAEAQAQADAAAAAAIAWMSNCSHPTRCVSETQCASKTAAAVKRAKTLKRNKRTAAAKDAALADQLDMRIFEADMRIFEAETAAAVAPVSGQPANDGSDWRQYP